MPTTVAATVSNGTARLCTTLAMNLTFSRHSWVRRWAVRSRANAVRAWRQDVRRGSTALDQVQSMLTVTGSESTSTSWCLLRRRLALRLVFADRHRDL